MVKQPPKPSKTTKFIKDPDTHAGVIFTTGAPLWRIISAMGNIDFLMSINKGWFGMVIDFFLSIGWLILFIIGVVLLILRYFKGEREQRQTPSWWLLIACSTTTFLFGMLLTAKSSGNIPLVISGWGDSAMGCIANFDTSSLVNFKDEYKVALACGIQDPTVDVLNDERITISNPFEIIGYDIHIVAPYRQKTAELLNQLHQTPNAEARMWFKAILIPNEVPVEKITTLSDLRRQGGIIIGPESFR